MRPLFAVIVAATILGGLQLYMSLRPQPVMREAEAERAAVGQFVLEVTLTFDAGPDRFALDPSTAPSLLVQLRGKEILRLTEAIPAGEQIRVDDVRGLVTGNNEFYVQASPQDTSQPISRAVRVRISRNGSPLTEQSLWSDPGDLIQGAVVVAIPEWVEVPAAHESMDAESSHD